jgi:hypothetical protein
MSSPGSILCALCCAQYAPKNMAATEPGTVRGLVAEIGPTRIRLDATLLIMRCEVNCSHKSASESAVHPSPDLIDGLV